MKSALFIFSAGLILSCNPSTADNTNSVRVEMPHHQKAGYKLSLEELASKMMTLKNEIGDDGEVENTFIKAFVEVLKQPQSFNLDFNNLKKYEIYQLVSDDKKLRIFYWLSPQSGSMWHVQNIIQYRNEQYSNVVIPFNDLYKQKEDEGSPTPFFDGIFKLHTKQKKLYLLTGYGQMSGSEPYTVAHVLNIENSQFNIYLPLFKVRNRFASQLFASMNLSENTDQDASQLKMTYRPKTKTLHYPEVSETANGSLFNGKRNVLKFEHEIFQ